LEFLPEGLCIFWELAKKEPLRNGDFQKKCVSPAEFGMAQQFSCRKYPKSALI